MIFLLTLLIGVIAGLRALMALAAVSWAAYLGMIDLTESPLAFMAWHWTPWIFTVVALVELVTDQLPSTPSRTVPPQFITRLILGALAGATIGSAGNALAAGLGFGVLGAVIGTLGGAWARGKMATIFGTDRPAALTEDIVALVAAFLIVSAA